MLPEHVEPRHEKQVAAWLLVCCALIFGMVVLGGVTRLTGSGLSMVDWDPLMGVIPPLTDADWNAVFAKYKQYPEYQVKYPWMTLEGFKVIFAYEYAHRLLGRIIGLAFFVPFAYFFVRRRLTRRTMPKLAALFVLGALQGVMGWFMVMSGLVDVPHVSQYRLTAHLMLAVLILAYMLWVALDLYEPKSLPGTVAAPVRRLATASLVLSVLTITSGGFVAGLQAGHAYNTFPLMAGKLIPDGLFTASPWWLSAFEDITTVQFDHRVLALTTAALVVATWIAGLRQPVADVLRRRLHLMLLAAAAQVALGITTLLLVVPVPLAAAHQAGALVLLGALIWLRHGIALSARQSSPASVEAAAGRGEVAVK